MAVYATYSYYTGTFLGTAIASGDFSRLILRASAVIDQMTFDRVAEIITANTDTATISKIENATCAVAEEIQAQEANGNIDGITSESSGSYSVSFGRNSSRSLTNQNKLSMAAGLWLANTGLMFRGFKENE